MRNASTRRGEKGNQFIYYPQVQTEDVLCNPRNPINPDSKPGESG